MATSHFTSLLCIFSTLPSLIAVPNNSALLYLHATPALPECILLRYCPFSLCDSVTSHLHIAVTLNLSVTVMLYQFDTASVPPASLLLSYNTIPSPFCISVTAHHFFTLCHYVTPPCYCTCTYVLVLIPSISSLASSSVFLTVTCIQRYCIMCIYTLLLYTSKDIISRKTVRENVDDDILRKQYFFSGPKQKRENNCKLVCKLQAPVAA